MDDVIDQAPEQSVEDRIASRFGFQGASETEDAPIDESVSDLFDIEFGGEKFQIPTKLKDAFMQNADYTRKTQDLAESRRSLDQVRTLAEQRQVEAAFGDSIRGEQQELNVIDAYLSQATKVDWTQMSTDQILRQKIELDNIKERRNDLQRSIQDKHSKFQTDIKEKIAELRGKSRDIASKSIKDFSQETESAVRAFAVSEGLAEAEVDNVLLDPRSYKIIWKAMQFDKVQSGAVKATEKADRVIRPGVASERMSQATANKLNFAKSMKSAKTSGQKASVIEGRLAGMFAKR